MDQTPVNYTIDTGNPAQQFTEGLKTSAGITAMGVQQQQQQLALQQQQLAAERQAQQRTDLAALASAPNPSARDYAQIVLKYPELKDTFKTSWDALDQEQQRQKIAIAGPVFAALQANKPDLASSLLQRNLQALKNSNAPAQEIQAAQTWADLADTAPDILKHMGGTYLASVMGKDFEKTFGTVNTQAREDAAAPSVIAKNFGAAGKDVADANATPQRVANETAEAQSRNTERAGRLALDADKLESETGIKLKEIEQKYGNIPQDSRKLVNESASASVTSRNSAIQMRDLAAQIRKVDPHSTGASTAEFVKNFTGNQDYVSSLRKEYTRLRSSQVNALLPQGPASDTDVRNAAEGFFKSTADPAQVALFLEGMARMQDYQSRYDNAKADWVAANQHLGPASRDIVIDGVQVPRGMEFTDFMKRTLKAPGAQTQPAPAGGKTNYMEKYGKPPAPNAPQG